MKKLLVLAGLSVLLFFSCSTSAGLVFDDSVPIEQSAWFNTYHVGTVIAYNGITVKWEKFLTEMVQIPAGDTLLEWDVAAVSGNTKYTGKALFQYNFQPQKQYFLMFSRKYDEVSIFGINVYTFDIGEKLPAGMSSLKDHLTAFVPFLNNQGSQKTVLD